MFLSSIVALVMLLGGGFVAVQTYSANASVNFGANFSEDDMAAVAYWAVEGWPQTPGKKQMVHQENRFDPNTHALIGQGFRNYGRHGDRNFNDPTRDFQMTNWINANLVNPQTPAFMEYDYHFRPTRRTPRDGVRIVRDYVNGVIFITYNHYTDFVAFAIENRLTAPVPSANETTNQGPQSEADMEDGGVENPPIGAPSGAPNRGSQNPLDAALMARYDNMVTHEYQYSKIWYAILLVFLVPK